MSKTLGDMTAEELLTSARAELAGLVELAHKVARGERAGDPHLLIDAYHGSIGARIAVGAMKLPDHT